ncbi:hypothetical protein LTR91_015545 [Friedmanniomyces endolithicus]|uniref:DUF202 domain-containing protein n=1 Tax=Friedmanniomyces endolithicus TaxID=329885 RepID=A0AAN6QLZ9_9PEZI|nr:hypothetical protein LTR94_008698 [Friedmanniomyces endolithicus]KAK0776838.1 hypothetical protein LTR59_014068 [Friedmanniomyces endolithicus]KAK0971474.1 hypothetical protein LTR91_015545 [Friedmanniomyces endolithicus]
MFEVSSPRSQEFRNGPATIPSFPMKKERLSAPFTLHAIVYLTLRVTTAHPNKRPQTRNAGNHFRLRLHRARSVILSPSELVEIRAAQRTFEGAYIRTSLSQFSFALIVLKIFTSEFYSIGALFAIYGAGILAASAFRRMQGNRQFFSEVGEDGLSRKR